MNRDLCFSTWWVCVAFLSALNESLIISRHRTLVPFDLTVGSNAAHLPRFGDGQSWSQCNFEAPGGGGWDTLVICSSRVLMSMNRKMTADPPKFQFLLKALEQYINFFKEEVFKRVQERSSIGKFIAGKNAYGPFGSYRQAFVGTLLYEPSSFCTGWVAFKDPTPKPVGNPAQNETILGWGHIACVLSVSCCKKQLFAGHT